MEHFLINSTVCLFVLWLFYKLTLENTSWHHFKRFYLLASIGVALIIPFIVVKTVIVPIEENAVFNYMNLNTSETALENQAFEIQWFHAFITLYLVGVVVMLWRFGKNISAFKINEEDETSSYSIYQLILRRGITVPHSFFNRIFVSQSDYENNLIPKAVFEHEKTHLDQKHSLDILLIEFLIVLFWFNPMFYILRYSIKLNHEFLADSSVLQQGVSIREYQKLIVKHATNNYERCMANTFHFPILKKRFNIMKAKTSKTSGLLRSLAVIPIIALLIVSCGQEETKFELENQQKILEEQELTLEEQALSPEEAFGEKTIVLFNNQITGKVTINEQEYSYKKVNGKYQFLDNEGTFFDYKSKGYEVLLINEIIKDLTQEDIEEYNRLAKKHKAYMDENNSLIAWKDETLRMQTIFNSMNENQRANNEPWPYIGKHNGVDYEAGQIPPPPPPPPSPSSPAAEIIEIEQEFMDWRKQNNRSDGFPSPIDYIDFYGANMDYYIDGEKVNPKRAKAIILKQGAGGVQIMPVNGVNSLKITRKSERD